MALASDSFTRRKSAMCDLSPALTRQALLEAFAEEDTDGSGFVDREELAKVVQSIGVEMQNPTDDMEALFETMDIDANGRIDVTEFITNFEPAMKRGGSTPMGQMDLAAIMKQTFDAMLLDARDQRTAVNRSFMQAREECGEWYCKK